MLWCDSIIGYEGHFIVNMNHRTGLPMERGVYQIHGIASYSFHYHNLFISYMSLFLLYVTSFRFKPVFVSFFSHQIFWQLFLSLFTDVHLVGNEHSWDREHNVLWTLGRKRACSIRPCKLCSQCNRPGCRLWAFDRLWHPLCPGTHFELAPFFHHLKGQR